jgi:importin subunit beta-1
MKGYILEATPLFYNLMRDSSVAVRDTTVWLLGRICELHFEVYEPNIIGELIMVLLERLGDDPRVAANAAWALMNLVEKIGINDVEEYPPTNVLSAHIERVIHMLIQAADRPESTESNLRTAAYESLSVLVTSAALDSFPLVRKLTELVIDRLSKTIQMEDAAVGIDDKMQIVEMQSSFASVLHKSVSRLKQEITTPLADELMRVVLTLLDKNISKNSPITEDLLLVIGSVANALEHDFSRYAEPFMPYLFQCLSRQDDFQVRLHFSNLSSYARPRLDS